jgi:hypothetical protein
MCEGVFQVGDHLEVRFDLAVSEGRMFLWKAVEKPLAGDGETEDLCYETA